MNDFHSELEGHLHAAARRRARRGPRIALMAAAATVSLALVLAALSAIDAPSDPEVAAPGPAATATATATPGAGACAGPPEAVLERFAVLRRERTAADRIPRDVLRRIDSDFPGIGRPDRIWPEAGRLAREVEGKRVWLFPVAMADCTPGLCWVQEPVGYCHTLADVRRPITLGIEEGPDPSVTALVPDGRAAIGVNGKDRVEGTTEGNVFFAQGATEIEEVEPAGCGAPVLSREAPAPELLEIVPGFRKISPWRMPDQNWRDALGDLPVLVHVEHARGGGEHGGMIFYGVPFTPLLSGCEAPKGPTEAGVCLIAELPRSEYLANCFTGTRIMKGSAVMHDLNAGVAFGLVPAGTRRATYGGTPMTIEGDFAYATVGGKPEGPIDLSR